MSPENTPKPPGITSQYLSSLDKSELMDLLLFKTRFLVSAIRSKTADRSFMDNLKQEVEKIYGEIKTR